MKTFVVVETNRYEVMAESLADANFVWRRWSIEREFEDDVEFVDGSSVIEEK